MNAPVEIGTVICPSCGEGSEHPVPEDACLFFLPCEACGTTIRPDPGDCCVFCSHGDRRCPPARRTASQRGRDHDHGR